MSDINNILYENIQEVYTAYTDRALGEFTPFQYPVLSDDIKEDKADEILSGMAEQIKEGLGSGKIRPATHMLAKTYTLQGYLKCQWRSSKSRIQLCETHLRQLVKDNTSSDGEEGEEEAPQNMLQAKVQNI